MRKLSLILISLIITALFSVISQAENLLQIYKQAYLNNPEIRKSASVRDTAFEKINEMHSALLPQLEFGADYTYKNSYGVNNNNSINSNVSTASIQLTQTLFNMNKWHALTLQEKMAYIQNVNYQADQQKLIFDTAQAYFKVLIAIDVLSYTQTQKKAIYYQMKQITQRFNVGLVSITDVENIRARYDNIVANEVTACNDLDNSLEVLRKITGNYYQKLTSLNINNFKISRLHPIKYLLKEAEQHNLSLLQARLDLDLAREQIRKVQDNNYPTIDLISSISISDSNYNGAKFNGTQYEDNNIGHNQVKIVFSLPIFQGGMISSQLKQAHYNFINASEQLEIAHRNMVHVVRSSFNNISASIKSIQAYKQEVVSAQSSMNAMETGYSLGTRTVIDVLDASTALYKAKQKFSNAHYDYLINLLNMKLALGSLNEQDILMCNNVLDKPVLTSSQHVRTKNI